MENFISVAFLVFTTALYLIVATYASRGVTTKDSYLLGDRQFSFISITLTLIATQLGAGMIFGTAAQSYAQGIKGIAYGASAGKGKPRLNGHLHRPRGSSLEPV